MKWGELMEALYLKVKLLEEHSGYILEGDTLSEINRKLSLINNAVESFQDAVISIGKLWEAGLLEEESL